VGLVGKAVPDWWRATPRPVPAFMNSAGSS
jgi:hypothetical protein